MKVFRLPQIVFILLVMGIILGFAISYPRLPERMASHFGMDGRPNGWQPKSVFTIFFFGALGIACVVSLAVPKLIGSLHPDMINLPHKEYWLAPERRADSVRFLQDQMALFGCAILGLLAIAMFSAIQANLTANPQMDPTLFFIGLGAFIAFAVYSAVRTFSRFGTPPGR